jgi:hypothetical protein
MTNLKIVAYGTKNFVETYSQGLKNDCKKFNYEYDIIIIPDFKSISEINFYIHSQMIDYISKTEARRVCFMDPECRILKRFPKEWTDPGVPWCTYKIQHGDQEILNYEYGNTLPTRIMMQPFFCGKEDLEWMQWWLKASTDVSNVKDKVYVPNELFLELALTFNNIKFKHGIITYNREYKGLHIVVKGSWSTKDTIVQHPSIQSVLDNSILPANAEKRNDNMLHTRELHNHFQDYDTIKIIDNLMLKEKTDIKDWPAKTLPVRINTINWFRCDEWLFRPSTGEVKNVNYSLIKYHPSINIKLKQNILTPAVKLYKETFKC